MRAFFKIQIFKIIMRRGLFLIGFVAVFSLFSVLEAYAQTAPNEPDNFVANDVSPTKITLQWDEPSDDGGSAVTGYKITYRIHPTQSYTVLENFTTTTVYHHDPVITDKIYIYSVYAYNAYGISEDPAQAQASPDDSSSPPDPIAPNPPLGLTATDTSPTSIALSWNKPAPNDGPPVDGYKIEVKIASGSFSILVANSASTVRTFAHNSLTTGTEYTYKVYALNSFGESETSNEASATPTSSSAPPEGSEVPSSPRSFKATAASDTEIGLSWELPGTYDGPPVTGYKIEFKKKQETWNFLI